MKLVEKEKLNLETIVEDLADLTYCLGEIKDDLDSYRNVFLNMEEHIKENKINHSLLDRINTTIRTFNVVEDVIWQNYLKLSQNKE
jgi:hypothetical protein